MRGGGCLLPPVWCVQLDERGKGSEGEVKGGDEGGSEGRRAESYGDQEKGCCCRSVVCLCVLLEEERRAREALVEEEEGEGVDQSDELKILG